MYADFTCRVYMRKTPYSYHTGDLAVKAGDPLWDHVCAHAVLPVKMFAGKSLWGGLSKNSAFDRKTEGRSQCFFSISDQPPSVSSVSLRLLRMQVKIGVSRSV